MNLSRLRSMKPGRWFPAFLVTLMMLCAGLPSRADDIDI